MSFLWHFPAGFPGSALPTTLPCDVRTFLEARLSEHPAAAWPAVSNLPPGAIEVNRTRVPSDHIGTVRHVYDVIYIDCEGCETPVAGAMDRETAANLARREASERGAGRIVCPDAVRPSNCVCVVPASEPARSAA